MHRKLVSILKMELELRPEGAVAILSGEPPDNLPGGGQLLKLMRAEVVEGINVRKVPVLPGSSLKGVVRSHCERIARSLGLWCCNLFDTSISEDEKQKQVDLANPEKFCGKKIEERIDQGEELSGAERYQARSCRICRLFGSTGIGSRFFLSDALPPRGAVAPSTGQRPHVAIDRVLGSVAEGPWYEEVVEIGRFIATLELRNFELWQLGLVALALRDLGEGRIRIGHSKSRGYGRVSLAV
jgi:CRISPR-associated RAMP protein (TIGR02581 family)